MKAATPPNCKLTLTATAAAGLRPTGLRGSKAGQPAPTARITARIAVKVALPAAEPRYRCTLEHERRLWSGGHTHIAGVDEAGRGPLAGPVVTAAVVLPQAAQRWRWGLNDSKQVAEDRREELYQRITQQEGVFWAVSVISPEEIDALNILRATHKGMAQCLAQLSQKPCHALVDGLPVHGLPCPHTALVKGDARSQSIAAASILAKVTRDRLMREAHELYPQYGFAQHKGYPTPAHLQALLEHGPCPLHRRSFAPVAQQELPLGI